MKFIGDGFKIKRKSLKRLKPILEQWIHLNHYYGKRLSWKDCAWWANERASTGILAAAAWTYGGIALGRVNTN